jgi:hypothetical protein
LRLSVKVHYARSCNQEEEEEEEGYGNDHSELTSMWDIFPPESARKRVREEGGREMYLNSISIRELLLFLYKL